MPDLCKPIDPFETTDMAALCARLHRRARRLGAAHSDAQDLSQETLLRLMQRMARAPLDAPEHYAMVILHNLMRARWRMGKDPAPLEQDAATTAPVAHGRLAVQTLCHAIAALPHDQARIMQMVLAGENSPAVIAATLGLPVGTVMSRLARARVRLRARIGLDPGTPITELL